MSGLQRFVVRSCCPGARDEGGSRGYIEPANTPEGSSFGFTGLPAPIVAEVEQPAEVEWPIALHEAGHAVISHLLGQRIADVSAVPPARVRYVEGQPDVLSAVQKIALAYFGEIGEQSDDRRYCPLSKDSEAEYLGRIQCFRFGSCDFCRMAAVAWQEVGLGAEYADAVAVLRAGQTFAFQVKETPQVRMAIHRLARVLTDERQVDGERAHSIINDLLEFGALTAAGKEPNCSNS